MTLAPTIAQDAPVNTEDTGKVATPSLFESMAHNDEPVSGEQPKPDAAAAATSKLQSDRDTARSQVTALTAEVESLKAQLAETGDVNELEYELSHERDNAWVSQLEAWVAEGATLQQVASRARKQMRDMTGVRRQQETTKSSRDNLITMVEGYDQGFAKFLRAGATHGMVISQDTLPSLKETYKGFSGEGATPAQAAAAAAPQHAAVPVHPTAPVVPQPGAAKISDAPIASKGKLQPAGRWFRDAISGPFGTTMERRPRE